MPVTPRYEGPPIISISGALGDQLDPLVRQRKRLETMVAELSLEDWGSASRCEGWTVQDVVAHLVGVNGFWQASVLAGLNGEPTRLLSTFDPNRTPAAMVDQFRGMPHDEVLDQFVVSNRGLLDVMSDLDDEGWAMLAEAPPGHMPIRLVAHHALWDSWVHERDIALPLGRTPPTEPDEVGSSLRYVCALTSALAIGSNPTISGPFVVEASGPTMCYLVAIGSTIAVRDDVDSPNAPRLRGDAVTLVEALSVRAPLPTSVPEEWRPLVEGLDRAFDARSSGSD